MAIVYKVKDGDSEVDRMVKIGEFSVDMLHDKLEVYKCKFLGEFQPAFNKESASDYYSRIVIEVTNDDLIAQKLPKVGFYLVEKLRAKDASFLMG
ncbi:hypothetical protein L4D76_00595 [Photobacterium sagamiensis]|uniref:hypothetical protein n=1 Tax=Photobacterium sagamiensis TaxID=2910241 RepID=UPI003D133465